MTLALFLQFLPYLFQAAAAVPEIWDYIQKVRASFQRTGEWTIDEEQKFTEELEALKVSPPDWWKPEAQS